MPRALGGMHHVVLIPTCEGRDCHSLPFTDEETKTEAVTAGNLDIVWARAPAQIG